jgi:diguanylate cyclase (GGDEF)-like protein
LRFAIPAVSYRLSVSALIVSLLLTVAAYVVFARQAELVLASQEKLEKSNQLIRTLRDVRDDIVDMETGQRGYLLTGDITYLTPFYRGQTALRVHLAELDLLFWEIAPEDVGTLQKLKELSVATDEELVATIAMRDSPTFDGGTALIGMEMAKQYMDEVRGLIDIQAMEYRTEAAEMSNAVTDEVFRARAALGFTGFALIFLVSAAFVNMRLGNRRLRDAVHRLDEEASHDPLTSLPNRRYLAHWLEHILARSKRQGDRVTALYLDLDGFSEVNNTLGHDEGDRLLKRVAETLKASTRESDFIARRGGDEFVIIVCGMDDSQLIVLAKKIVALLSKPSPGSAREAVACGVSIGVATAVLEKDDSESLLKKADEAMYEAKAMGKNAFSFYGAA